MCHCGGFGLWVVDSLLNSSRCGCWRLQLHVRLGVLAFHRPQALDSEVRQAMHEGGLLFDEHGSGMSAAYACQLGLTLEAIFLKPRAGSKAIRMRRLVKLCFVRMFFLCEVSNVCGFYGITFSLSKLTHQQRGGFHNRASCQMGRWGQLAVMPASLKERMLCHWSRPTIRQGTTPSVNDHQCCTWSTKGNMGGKRCLWQNSRLT